MSTLSTFALASMVFAEYVAMPLRQIRLMELCLCSAVG